MVESQFLDGTSSIFDDEIQIFDAKIFISDGMSFVTRKQGGPFRTWDGSDPRWSLTGGHQGGVQPLAHNGKGIH